MFLPSSQSGGGLRRVILTGFMGCGKTTVGRLLAAKLGWRFADLDDAVEASLGVPVPRIFAERGESAFRIAEVETLRELMAGTCLVIALGGGAPETEKLRSLLLGAQETAVVHLQAAFDPLYNRCLLQAQSPLTVERPLLGSREQAQSRFNRRGQLYQAVATCTVAADPGTPAEVAQAILAKLGPQLIGFGSRL